MAKSGTSTRYAGCGRTRGWRRKLPSTRLGGRSAAAVATLSPHVTGSRRLSQAISEGDAISIIASVGDAAAARMAEAQGADGIVLVEGQYGVRLDTDLPILFRGA